MRYKRRRRALSQRQRKPVHHPRLTRVPFYTLHALYLAQNRAFADINGAMYAAFSLRAVLMTYSLAQFCSTALDYCGALFSVHAGAKILRKRASTISSTARNRRFSAPTSTTCTHTSRTTQGVQRAVKTSSAVLGEGVSVDPRGQMVEVRTGIAPGRRCLQPAQAPLDRASGVSAGSG